MKYNILKSKLSPHYENGERVRAEGHPAWRVEWEVVGQCNSMSEAVALGFRGCALEQIK